MSIYKITTKYQKLHMTKLKNTSSLFTVFWLLNINLINLRLVRLLQIFVLNIHWPIPPRLFFYLYILIVWFVSSNRNEENDEKKKDNKHQSASITMVTHGSHSLNSLRPLSSKSFSNFFPISTRSNSAQEMRWCRIFSNRINSCLISFRTVKNLKMHFYNYVTSSSKTKVSSFNPKISQTEI